VRRSLAIAALTLGASLAVAGCNSGHRSQTTPGSTVGTTAQRSIAGSVGSEGWYSVEQAAQGAALFKQKCAVCRGANLQGGAGPSLVGNQFFLRYHYGKGYRGTRYSTLSDITSSNVSRMKPIFGL
jgi:hypothetical protein